ncbi:MAG: cation-transporting P-type ATPase, partial [Alphaproteobacteria bacterium]|nr:cation-transporting P-type ATPase [Alphaproteobacteria bacterium]
AGFGYGEFAEAIGIGSVLIIVATVNVITKMRSQKATLELRRQASKLSCNVLRNGKVINLDSSEIVVDDIVLIQAGETIPADGYIIAGQVSVNNSILNGESEEVHKSAIPNFVYNRKAAITAEDYTDKNQVFSGTTVHGGMGTMRVTRVGMDTENAKILKTLGSVKEVKTTLQIQLDKLAESISKIGGICAVAIAVLITVLHFISGEAHSLGDTIYIIVSALTLALTVFVAAVPEGLPFIIEIITSQNARKMTQANLLAKNPHKIPEAGNIQLLCTDKTGTITYGRMMPIANYTGDGTDIGFAYNQNGAIEEFTRAIIINGRAMLDADGKIVGGNSTERALFSALNLSAQKIAMIKRENKVIKKVPFDSAKKFSFTTVRFGKTIRTYIMAAPEIILDHTSHYINKDGKILPLRKSKLQSLMNKNNKNAMRSIAVAYYDRDFSNDVIPKKLVFVSLSILRDEVRSGVLNVVESLHKSGVQVMMITGDNLNTAHMIAKQSGIITSTSDIAISANDFDSLSNERARKMLSKI